MKFSVIPSIPALLSISLTAVAVTALAQSLSAPPHIETSVNYGQLPLSFEANQGQAGPGVQFLSHGRGYSLYLSGNSAMLALVKAGKCSPVEAHLPETPNSCPQSKSASAEIVRMTLAGVSRGSHVLSAKGEQELPGKVNYLVGNDPAKWRTDLPTYAKVRYPGVWPGIDLVYYGKQGQLEYDFLVAPKANPSRIRFAFEGASLKVDSDGNLTVTAPRGEISFRKPTVYQQIDGKRRSVEANFTLVDSSTLGFTVGSYDGTRPLVIDPVLVYSTYLGGSGSNGIGDQGNGLAVDSTGSAYIVGLAYSPDFPVTAGAFQDKDKAPAGTSTVFVTKLNSTGTALVYSTFLGGSGGDAGYGIALDSANNAYVTGATFSQDFPVTCGAVRTTNEAALKSGASTGFVAKLNTEGNRLVYSTFLGGSGNKTTPAHGDVSQAIAVDATGNAYVTGYTSSPDFPTTPSAFQPTADFAFEPSVSRAFVTKLNSAGTGLAYSTYLGGTVANIGDFGNSVAVDSSGDAFVAGSTDSEGFPVTAGAFQTSQKGPSTGFVTKLNPKGTAEMFSTYLGGSSGESVTAIALDGTGAVYAAGNTLSRDFPTTPNVIEPSGYWPGPSTGFVTKFSADGSAQIYSTFLEGIGTTISGLAVDNSGTAYIVGTAPTANLGAFAGFQVTADALPTPASTGNSAFVVKLDPTATVFNYATLLGGSANDGAAAVALDSNGNVFVTGIANSVDFPTTAGAFETIADTPSGTPASSSELLDQVSQPSAPMPVEPASQPVKNFATRIAKPMNSTTTISSNAFVSKFALAGENNQSVYPAPVTPPSLIGTEVTASVIEYDVDNAFYCGGGDLMYHLVGLFSVSALAPFPVPITGIVSVDTPGGGDSEDVSTGGYIAYGETAPGTYTVTVSYLGDTNYSPSSTSFQFDFSCPNLGPPPFTASRGSGMSARPQAPVSVPLTSSVRPIRAAQHGDLNMSGPKFALPPSTPNHLSLEAQPASSQTPACIAPPPALSVGLRNTWREYGAANPSLTYSVSGLLNGDTVTVTPQTTANASSPVGNYPITALVTGDALSHYALSVTDATFFVFKAQLNIAAKNTAIAYGQTPAQPSLYTIAGFVNGETQASATTGAPILSTTVTSTSPVGFYPIKVQVGTLTAANYYFVTSASGEGSVGVYKAPLTIHPDSFTIHVADPLPSFTYTMTGFVNQDTQASATTGTPALTTTAPSTAKPGRFYIIGNRGTLAARNYYISNPSAQTNGILTILK